jgi:hypothetical protein
MDASLQLAATARSPARAPRGGGGHDLLDIEKTLSAMRIALPPELTSSTSTLHNDNVLDARVDDLLSALEVGCAMDGRHP